MTRNSVSTVHFSQNVFFLCATCFLIATPMGNVVLASADNATMGGNSSNTTSPPTPQPLQSSGNDGDRARTNGFKAMSIVCTLTLSLILNNIVIRLTKVHDSRYDKHLKVANAFGAGIFLVLSLGHLLPESVDVLTQHLDPHRLLIWRPAYIVCVAGYLFMIMLQRGLFAFDEHLLLKAAGDVSDDDSEDACSEGRGSRGHEPTTSSPPPDEAASGDSTQASDAPPSATVIVDASPAEPVEAQHDQQDSTPSSEPTSTGSDGPVAMKSVNEKKKTIKGRPTVHHVPLIILLLVFSIHSFTEGMVLGLQHNSSDVLLVFLAIFLHQWAEDITFALRTGKSGTLNIRWRMFLTTVEAVSAPLGMAFGWGVESVIGDVAAAFITTFSAGTFIMISTTEVVPDAMPPGQRNVAQFCGMCVGCMLLYGVMALLEAFLAPPV